MADNTKIEWSDATWNPTTGCTKVSPGCARCYISRTPAFRIAGRKFVKGHIPLRLHEDRIQQPLRWKRPRRIFVNSLSDLFHPDVPDQFLHDVYHTMEYARQHVFQVLTKRPERMREYLNWRYGPDEDHPRGRIPSRHIWHGVSVENQYWADIRIPLLLRTRSAVRFISAEPLLGLVNVAPYLPVLAHPAFETASGFLARAKVMYDTAATAGFLGQLDWVIVGGESGPGARPFDIAWARAIRDQCRQAGVPYFYKQGGSTNRCLHDTKGGCLECIPIDLRVREFPNAARS